MSLRDKYLGTPTGPESTEATDYRDALFHLPAGAAGDIHGVHRMLEALFGPRTQGGYLWSLEQVPNGPACLVRSAVLPPAMRESAVPVMPPEAGARLLFRVTANPTAKSFAGDRRRPFTKENTAGRLRWFERRAGLAGFEASDVAVATEQRWIERNRRRFWLDASTFSGRLTVKDAAAFTRTMRNGFGYGRAWGFGLLQVFPEGSTEP